MRNRNEEELNTEGKKNIMKVHSFYFKLENAAKRRFSHDREKN
jgi:hypothetical protein